MAAMNAAVPLRKHELPLSLNEATFVQQAVEQGVRVDGRAPFELRELKIRCGRPTTNGGHVELSLGETRVLAVVSTEAVEPYPDRPTEGFFKFEVEFSPMASPRFEPGRPPDELAAEVTRTVERGLREGRAVDTESLCIVGGKLVWSLRVDCHILDHGGNLIDACALATIAALLSYRRPDVTVSGDSEITIHSLEEREPVPLSIHHVPIAVSFGDFGAVDSDRSETRLVADPSLKEEMVMKGRLTLTLNPHRELCVVQKSGGSPLPAAQIVRAAHIAALKVEEMHATLSAALDAADALRNPEQKRRRQGIGKPRSPPPAGEQGVRVPRPSTGFAVGGRS